jgi:DNA-binding transcriptional MerR regulator
MIRSAVEPVDVQPVSLDDMLATGVSYRQLDYWCRQGYLRPTDATPGYGTARVWPAAERDVALLITRLQSVGVELSTAARIARSMADSDTDRAELGGGVFISIDKGEDA